MSDFITNGAAVLPAVKSDVRVPTGGVGEWAADDCNELRQAALDLRGQAILEASTRAAADAAIVASGATPADVGLAPVIATGSTATRTVNDRFADVLNVRDFGAVGNGSTDDTAAIQAALTAGAGKEVWFPPGTYIVIPSGVTSWLKVSSGTSVRGAGVGATTIKVADSTGPYHVIFSGVGATLLTAVTGAAYAAWTDVAFEDLTIDQNVSGNAEQVTLAAGGVQQVALSYNPTRVAFRRVHFKNCGVQAVALNASTAEGNEVVDCHFTFTNNGAGQYDNSAVYMEGSGWNVSGNTFSAANKTNGDARAAIEFHGDGRIEGNGIDGFSIGMNVCSSSYAVLDTSSTSVVGNVITRTNNGILIYALTAYQPLSGLVVADNSIQVNNADRAAQYPSGIAFMEDAVAANVYDSVSITDNVIVFQKENRAFTDQSTCHGIGMRPLGDMTNVNVTGNIVKNVPNIGLNLVPIGAATGKRISILDNTFVDCGNNTTAPDALRVGILFAGTLEDVRIEGNAVLESAALGKLGIEDGVPTATRVTVYRNTISPTLTSSITTSGVFTDIGGTVLVQKSLYVDEADPWIIDASTANIFYTNFTVAARAIGEPTNPSTGQVITLYFQNNSLADLDLTWDASFSSAPWVTGVGASCPASKAMAISFVYSGIAWVETSRTPGY